MLSQSTAKEHPNPVTKAIIDDVILKTAFFT
jgi:hypothetical protein